MGQLRIGRKYQLEMVSDPATPGITALVFQWIGTPGSPVTVDAVAPGATSTFIGKIPTSQLLRIDADLPNKPAAKVALKVIEDGVVIANSVETVDFVWTFLVDP